MALTGCGDSGPVRVPVQGTIRIGGEALKSGVIRFIPMEGTQGPSAVATVTDGDYALSAQDGPIEGNHRVEIEALNYLGFELDDEQAFVEQVEKKNRRRVPSNPVPEVYNRKSVLTAEVTLDGDHRFDFPLEPVNSRAGGR